MKNKILIAFSILFAAALACGAPATQPVRVETIVAGTFQALTAPVENAVATTPSDSSLLPHSLYYLNNDSAGLKQVFRVEKDGVTVKQITFEPVDVTDYDPSRVDGSVVYVSNNQLLLIKANGSDPRLLVDGGAVDENNPFLTKINAPVWSPHGETIAYGHKGLNFYLVATGQSNLVLENDWDNSDGFMFPRELFCPHRYSPDGSKLLLWLGYYEGAGSAIYYPASETFVRLSGDASRDICCDLEWTPDSAALYSGRATIGMMGPGLWKIDAMTGAVATLLPGDAGNGTFNLASYPFLAPDGVTDRAPLRSETFEMMNEALWSPNGDFVVVAFAPIQDVYYGGRAEIVYVNSQKPNVPLVDFALEMRWGE